MTDREIEAVGFLDLLVPHRRVSDEVRACQVVAADETDLVEWDFDPDVDLVADAGADELIVRAWIAGGRRDGDDDGDALPAEARRADRPTLGAGRRARARGARDLIELR